YSYVVNVPVITQQKQLQTFYTCVPQEVVRQVPVCRMVPTSVVDPCTGCTKTVCQPVSELRQVRSVVMQSLPQTREVMVNVCNYQTEMRQGRRVVYHMVPQTREVMVNVCNYQTETRQGTRTVCEMVPQTREVMVNVCNYQTETRQGIRYVSEM